MSDTPARPQAADPEQWWEAPVLAGAAVRLEALTQGHAPGYAAALADPAAADDVFRWLRLSPPRDAQQARSQVADALRQRDARIRLPFAQVEPATGAVMGTTSYYEIDPDARSLAIGHTWLGRAWQRTAVNTESKLLLLTRAFEDLGAVRVVWHTDARNERSRAAIARLGAQQEGILRKHKPRRDGTWRDTVQFAMTDDDWPAARSALIAALTRPRG